MIIRERRGVQVCYVEVLMVAFLPRDATQSAVMPLATVYCLSVCLSVSPSVRDV